MESLTNYKDFENFMTNIFEGTYDEQWMNRKKGQQLNQILLQNMIIESENKTK